MTKTFQTANKIYAITDCDNFEHDDILKKTTALFNAGVNILQYRNKQENDQKKSKLAFTLLELCNEFNVLFIINDDVQLAKKLDADGIHIGKNGLSLEMTRNELPDKIIGVSCYNELDRAVMAENNGADYIAFGSFFSSINKPNAPQANTQLLKQAKSVLTIPIVAIGGITPENSKELVLAGADYLAVISGLYAHSDPYFQAKQYLSLYQN